MKVLVATWGDPNRWEEVVYHLKDEEFRSKTTYIPLFKVENPDKGIIIVQNSLFPIFNVPNEDSLKEKIIEKLKEFKADEKILEKTDVIVTISSGKYSSFKFNANFYDILLNLFLQLYFHLKDAEEVILDLTHGINYLPNITILTLAYLKKIIGFRLKVYNATPVTKDVKESWILELGEVNLESKIKLDVEELENVHNELKKIFREKMDFNVKHAFKLLVSYLYGLIFPLVKNSNFDFDEKFLFELIPKQIRKDDEYILNTKANSEELFKLVFTILFAKKIAKEFGYKKITLDVIREIEEKIPNPVAKKLIENEHRILKLFYETNEQIFLGKEKISYKEAQNMLRNNLGERFRRRELAELRDFFAHVSLLWHDTILNKNKELKFADKTKIDSFVKKIKEIEL